jgi:hypothetical protein
MRTAFLEHEMKRTEILCLIGDGEWLVNGWFPSPKKFGFSFPSSLAFSGLKSEHEPDLCTLTLYPP